MKRMCMIAMTVLALVFSGCKSQDNGYMIAKETNTYAVIVGMENSKFAGSCPGAGLDAERMYELLLKFTPSAVLLRDENATKANVVSALKDAVAKADNGLVIFYYSGHGGSEPFPDTGIEEEDGKDEFYCLWDTWFRDNEMWNIISSCRGRIMLINDCCHSETIYRTPRITLRNSMPLSLPNGGDSRFSMLCWSGCPDNTYSYGSATGGQFTNALLRHFDCRKSYEVLWNEIKNDKTLRMFENPQKTTIGNGFVAKPIFR